MILKGKRDINESSQNAQAKRKNHENGQIINGSLKVVMSVQSTILKCIAPRGTLGRNFMNYTLLSNREFFSQTLTLWGVKRFT